MVSDVDRRARDAAYQREKRARRKAAGLCRQCGAPVEDGHAACPRCREQARANARYKIARGVCTRCGAETVPGQRYCAVCKDKTNECRRKNRDPEKNRKHCAALYEKRKAAGVCVTCGKRPPPVGRVTCRQCNAKTLQTRHETHPLKNYKGCGLCRWCGDPVAEGYSYCPACLVRVRAAAAKARAAQVSASK